MVPRKYTRKQKQEEKVSESAVEEVEVKPELPELPEVEKPKEELLPKACEFYRKDLDYPEGKMFYLMKFHIPWLKYQPGTVYGIDSKQLAEDIVKSKVGYPYLGDE